MRQVSQLLELRSILLKLTHDVRGERGILRREADGQVHCRQFLSGEHNHAIDRLIVGRKERLCAFAYLIRWSCVLD
jgi:hypothetical protein